MGTCWGSLGKVNCRNPDFHSCTVSRVIIGSLHTAGSKVLCAGVERRSQAYRLTTYALSHTFTCIWSVYYELLITTNSTHQNFLLFPSLFFPVLFIFSHCLPFIKSWIQYYILTYFTKYDFFFYLWEFVILHSYVPLHHLFFLLFHENCLIPKKQWQSKYQFGKTKDINTD